MWNRREVKKRGKKMFLRNWLAMVSICFLLAFTGAEFVSSASFIHDFDVGEMLGNDQVLTQETNVSNWNILMHWLNIDPDDDSHPVIQAAQQDIQPAFDNLTQPFSAFFNLLYRSDFKGWVGICLAAIGGGERLVYDRGHLGAGGRCPPFLFGVPGAGSDRSAGAALSLPQEHLAKVDPGHVAEACVLFPVVPDHRGPAN